MSVFPNIYIRVCEQTTEYTVFACTQQTDKRYV